MSLTQGYPNTFSGQVTNQVTKRLNSETIKIYNDINEFMAADGHAHTGSGTDGAPVSYANLTNKPTATDITNTPAGNISAVTVQAAINELDTEKPNRDIGELKLFPATSPPADFLKANGALLSRTTYASLWTFAQASGNIDTDANWTSNKLYGGFSTGDGSTTFRIPDARGLGIRFWDDGRGVDTGRAIGSYQDDMVGTHTHPNGMIANSGSNGGLAGNAYLRTYDQQGDTGNNTGTETRIKSFAPLACIRYQ